MQVAADGDMPAEKPAVAAFVEEALNGVTADSAAVLAEFADEVRVGIDNAVNKAAQAGEGSQAAEAVKQQKARSELDAAIEEFNKNKDKMSDLEVNHFDNEIDWKMPPNSPTSIIDDAPTSA